MYRADLELLNNSIQGAGANLLHAKQLAEEKRRNISEELIRREMEANQQKHYEAEEGHYQAENQFRQAQLEHYKQLEDKAGLHQAFQDMQSNTQNLRTSMGTIGEMVKNGALDPDDADDYFKSAVDQLDPDMKQKMMATPEFQAAYNGDIDWSKIPKAPPSLTPVNVPQGGGLTPAGHYVAPPKADRPIKTGEIVDPATGNKTFTFGTPNLTPIQGTAGAQPVLMRNKAGQTVKVPPEKAQWAKDNGYTPAQ